MGGDLAPNATVQGAVDAIRETGGDLKVMLVGKQDAIEQELASIGTTSNIEIRHAGEVIGMEESASAMVKTKKESSIVKGLEFHREGETDAFLSAGNTGAVMAASTLLLGRVKGVQRPTIGTFLPHVSGVTLLIDAGANVNSKPSHLMQFGVMGSIYFQLVTGNAAPRVGLVSVGEEEGKGDELTKEAHALLKTAPVNFIGNIEGRDLLRGTVDVAVCDGFVGNTVLKFAESVPSLLKAKFRQEADKSFFRKLWIGMISGTLRNVMKDWDYQEHGGVPLLGVNGVSIIGHGSSTPLAIKNMILRAKEMAERNINARIAESLGSLEQGEERS